jgi:flagellar FliJ protein
MSTRFRFRLEAVRALREQTEQQAQHELARELAARDEHARALDDATRDADRARAAGTPEPGATLTGNELQQRQAFVERTERLRQVAQAGLVAQERQVEASRGNLQEAARDREALERLKRNRLADHQRQLARAESAHLDEVALTRFARRTAEAA